MRPCRDAWLRVFVREPPRAGLREEVQELLPRALEVRIDPELLPAPGTGARDAPSGPAARRASCSPTTWTSRGQRRRRGVRELFDELYDEVSRLMRPLRLDLAGFTVFRDETTVDFTDADFFALVGPTGSGKSTVLDAICFALYGTVPRWGDRPRHRQRARPVGRPRPGCGWSSSRPAPGTWPPGWSAATARAGSRPPAPACSCCRPAST